MIRYQALSFFSRKRKEKLTFIAALLLLGASFLLHLDPFPEILATGKRHQLKTTNTSELKQYTTKLEFVSLKENITIFLYSLIEKCNHKILSRIFFSFAIIILVILIIPTKGPKKYLFIILPIICIEIFLRISEKNNRYLNINKVLETPVWNIEKTTNLFGNYNQTSIIELYKGIFQDKDMGKTKYPTQKSENIIRLLCLGSSPLGPAPTQGSDRNDIRKIFPVILEEKINNSVTAKKCEVINAGANFNAFQISIYFKDILIKLKPDIVVFYVPEDIPFSHFIEYERMKELLQKHSDWINNQRLLFMALQFKTPIKPIVQAYNSLCNSYLFMALEYMREQISLQFSPKDIPLDIFRLSLISIVDLCQSYGIKILLIPQLDYPNYTYGEKNLELMIKMSHKNDNIYFLDLRKVFKDNHSSTLFYDSSHLLEDGHQIIAEEIYKKLLEEKLIQENSH